jgi:hypothetical protein
MAGLLAIPGIVHAAQLPATWSNLVQVSSQNFRTAYLLPGADFRAYNKIMLDPTEVDFVDNWVWKMNTSYSFAKGRTSDRDANTIAAAVRDGFQQRWSDAFTKAGWTVVTQPGPDVLRVRTIVFNLAISAPYTVTQSQGSVRSVDAGQASLLVEARDSESGAVLGSILDARRAGENKAYMPRSKVSNKADFGRLFNDWADASIRGLAQLKALSPVDANARAIKTSE